ncbi:MAG: Uma2 family endonuclease [Gemmataceae bacterium]|nr:Uma2 family endonuclease [Gemmataceae bacterium]
MATITKLGLADHGRAMTLDEFFEGDYEEGYKYELIEGRLEVSPAAGLPHEVLRMWIIARLSAHALSHPSEMNFVSGHPRVIIRGAAGPSAPEADTAGYRNFPLDADLDELDWPSVNPILLVEVISGGTADKDTERNVRLYRRVRTLQEYWIIDPRPDSNRPSLTVHRRAGRRWEIIEVPFGAMHTTPLLPSFSLVVDPRSR